MGLENKYNPGRRAEEQLRPPLCPDSLEYKVFDFREIKTTEINTFINLIPGKSTYLPESHAVIVNGDKRTLNPWEERLLQHFVKKPGQPLPHDELFESAWGPERQYSPTQLAVLVMKLRRKAEPNPRVPTIIQSVRGVGYRFGDSISDTHTAYFEKKQKSAQIKLTDEKVYNPGTRTLEIEDDSDEVLTVNQHKLLMYLYHNAGQTISRQQLVQDVWDGTISARSVDTAVDKLRMKVGDELIEAISEQGYRLANFDPSLAIEVELQQGHLKIYPEARTINLTGRNITLTEYEHKLLLALTSHIGEPVSREDLTREVWDERVNVRQINQYISKLRSHGIDIRNKYGLGYELAPVRFE